MRLSLLLYVLLATVRFASPSVFAQFPNLTQEAPPASDSATWPELPERDGFVDIPAQEWPYRPGPRQVRIYLHYPAGELKQVGPGTGIILSLHNWGGTGFVGTADPRTLVERFNLVAIGVDYLQSGKQASIDDPQPYDFGWLQALDALRGLYFVYHGLQTRQQPFATGRIYCTGGSGGGNVTLMANKLAPRTFACVIDLCGMAKLTDDIAFQLPGGSSLNARYQSNPSSANYLTRDEQEIRFVAHPDHLAEMRRLGTTSRLVVVHGTEDDTCPTADAREMVHHLEQAGLNVDAFFVEPKDVDGRVFTSAGHSLGDRTEIVLKVAEPYLQPDGPHAAVRSGLSDFERREILRYRTSQGAFNVSYANGYPVGRFELATPPSYPERRDLTYYLDESGGRQPLLKVGDWERRRQQILQGFQGATGPLPGAAQRVPLDPTILSESTSELWTRRKVSFQSEPGDRVAAWLFLPSAKAPVPRGTDGSSSTAKRPAVLGLHQTTAVGKDEPAGVNGDPQLQYARELADRGYIVLAPDYPSFGEHPWDFGVHGPPDDQDPFARTVGRYASGTMKAIWDNLRAVDYLETLPEVDAQRIGCIGHSLGGHNAIFTAVIDTRLKVIVSSCGFCTFTKDDVPSWTGPRYMPRIASVYGNDAGQVPFDFTELIASLSPRPFLACAATADNDFDVEGVREVMQSAAPIYELYGCPEHLQAEYPEAPHSFPQATRERAYLFIDRHL